MSGTYRRPVAVLDATTRYSLVLCSMGLPGATAAATQLLPILAHLLPELVNEQTIDDWVADVINVVAVTCPGHPGETFESQKAK